MIPKNSIRIVPGPKIDDQTRHRQSHTKFTQESRVVVFREGNDEGVRSWVRWILHIGKQLAAGYDRLQVSHRGSYSIERLQAFQVYCEKTSVFRAIAVCVLTPVPSLLATVLIECIPLQDPALGWKANYMFWIRFFVSGVIVIIGSTYQVVDMVHRVKLSGKQCLVMGIISMSVYLASVIAIAMLWVFPVPFGIVLGIGPCFLVFLVALVITIGPNTFKTNPGLAEEMKLQLYVLSTEAVIAVLYPALNSFFLRASSTERAGLMLLLPVTKLIMKNIVAWACGHLEDYVPVIAVFSIEVFNALYVATCMQATKSTLATIVIVTFDAVFAAVNFHSMLGRTQTIQRQRHVLFSGSEDAKHPSGELVSTVVATSRNLRIFGTKTGKIIRVRSPLTLRLGIKAERILDSLLNRQKAFINREVRKGSRTNSRAGGSYRSPASIVPHDNTQRHPVRLLDQTAAGQERLRETQEVELVESTLQLLFQCEYHALVEYVECAVPVLFGVYLTILCHLPAHKFYPHTREMAPGQLEGMMTNLSVYVALEVFSFVVMHLVLKKKFKLSALYQLAFVLETHVVQMQSRLIVWVVFILQFTLQHYGVDFTFRFAWVH